MAIVWPFEESVEAYAAKGREVEVPRADCPTCARPMSFWFGYWRFVRVSGHCHRIWLARGRCASCKATHVLLPAFLCTNRLDAVESGGEVIESVVTSRRGVRPAAAAMDIPYTTARGWVRRFVRALRRIVVAFRALAVELGGHEPSVSASTPAGALAAIQSAWRAAQALPGWSAISRWRFASCVVGGRLVSTNTNSPFLIVGKRRFIAPSP